MSGAIWRPQPASVHFVKKRKPCVRSELWLTGIRHPYLNLHMCFFPGETKVIGKRVEDFGISRSTVYYTPDVFKKKRFKIKATNRDKPNLNCPWRIFFFFCIFFKKNAHPSSRKMCGTVAGTVPHDPPRQFNVDYKGLN